MPFKTSHAEEEVNTMKKMIHCLIILIVCSMFSGCATFKTDMIGAMEQPGEKNIGANKVSALFILRHIKQSKGIDAIPKLQEKHHIIRDFDNLLLDALPEISNLGHYTSFTEYPSDVSDPERRAKRDKYIEDHDYVIRIRIGWEHSFIKRFFGTVISSATLSLVPTRYTRSYSISLDVHGSDGEKIKTYQRGTSLTTWTQFFLIFIQPFHSETIKAEQIYIEFLHDIFQEIDSDKILG